MKNCKYIKTKFESDIATLSLCGKGKGNPLNLPMVREIRDLVENISSNTTIKVLIIESLNAEFCVGGDIDYIFNNDEDPQALLSEMLHFWHQTILYLTSCPQTVVVAINGAVSGGGLGFALVADYVVASNTSQFSAGFIKLGLSTDSGLSWFLPRQIGIKRAKQFLLMNQPITAEIALNWGLINEVVDTGKEKYRVLEVAKTLSQMSVFAMNKTKKLLDTSLSNDLVTHLHSERESILESANSEGVKYRVNSFLAKRRV